MMIADTPTLPAQADLRYLLTLQSGQLVALINMSEYLKTVLCNEGLHVQTLLNDVPPPSANFDAIILAPPFPSNLDTVLQAIAKTLRPNGQVLLCIHNRVNIRQLKNLWNTKKEGTYSLSAVQVAAKTSGLIVRGVYGIYDRLENPRILVPLENPKATAHFFDTMFIPYTVFAQFLIRIAPLFVTLRLHPLLYTDLCLILDAPC